MNATIMKELNYMKIQGIKPNFSELQRLTGLDRHTLKKHYDAGGYKVRKTRVYNSSLDKYSDIINEKLEIAGITYRGIYELLKDRYNHTGSYSNFKAYMRKKGLKKKKTSKAHVRYETAIGKQLQVDWKEDLAITTKHGEVINFNLLGSTLGHSRLHRFVYSETKTREAFKRCFIETLQYLGGVPEEILTDNMSAICNKVNGKRYKYGEILQMEKDLDIKIKLCKPKTPETKGKVESANRFVSRLLAYNNEIEDLNDLLRVIEKLNKDINEEINSETNVAPIVLFKKEKEYLKPLPNKNLLDSYVVYDATCTVPSTLLVPYHGSKYSVPVKYLNKRVKLIQIENLLYIYYNTELVEIHKISNKPINYSYDDYKSGLETTIKHSEKSIDEITSENLKLLGELSR